PPLALESDSPSGQPIDGLGFRPKIGPLEFRRNNIGDARWLGVLNAAAAAAAWKPKVAASALSDAEVVRGRGIALGTHHVSYGAAVADIEVDRRTGNIVATHVYGALDAGQAGVVSGAAFRRTSASDRGRGAAPRRTLDRRRRGGHGRDRGRDRQRVLRRDRRAAAPIPDDARAREGGARRQDVSAP